MASSTDLRSPVAGTPATAGTGSAAVDRDSERRGREENQEAAPDRPGLHRRSSRQRFLFLSLGLGLGLGVALAVAAACGRARSIPIAIALPAEPTRRLVPTR